MSARKMLSVIPLYLQAALVMFLGLLPMRSNACTLWGVAGQDASDGTIVSKNRDWKPDHTQVLKMRRDEKGVRPAQSHIFDLGRGMCRRLRGSN
jgi:hypothetical protein